MNFRLPGLFACALALSLAACASTPSKPLRPGIDELNSLVADSTQQLLQDIREENAAADIWLAYAGVDNMSAADLGSAKADTDQVVTEILVNSKEFRMISERQVQAARRAAGIARVEELTLQAPRDKFLAQLTEQGRVPEYLMFGNFTSVDADREDGRERRYRLTLQMMDSKTGEIAAQRSGVFTQQENR